MKEKNGKKYIAIFLLLILILSQTFQVFAEENSTNEWYEMVEEDFEVAEDYSTNVMPYTMYIVDVLTSIAKISSSKVGLRADVYCASTVQSISVKFYLQKKSGSSWVNVASGTSSTSSNVSSTAKQMTVSGLSSGTYRAKTVSTVTDRYGYSESITGYSGSINI